MSVTVKAVVTVKETDDGLLSNISLTTPIDGLKDLLGKTFLLELVSSELHPSTNLEKEGIKGYARKVSEKDNVVKYESKFNIPKDFGEVGAILVENETTKEIFINDIALEGFSSGPVNFACESWVHSKYANPDKRIFFSNKCYLPSETPSGLKKLRQKELENLRGNGKGERKESDRIYDYDTYNDLGDPDSDINLLRPVLGGKKHPYPRRCRTGRKPSKTDPQSESRSSDVYVPRDDKFSDIKQDAFTERTLKNVLHSLLPQIATRIVDETLGFPNFTAIDSLFKQGILLPKGTNVGAFPKLVQTLAETGQNILLFPTPELFERDKFSWFSDEEFARETLAGLNPFSIELVREWPIRSKLDPKTYGPADSLLTEKLIEYEICGTVTAEEAFKQKRLFMLDYHDLLLPYVSKVRELEGTTLYGSRTLFFLTNDGTLKPVAIELTRPPIGDKPVWRHVFTPSFDATSCWLWRMAKAHVCAHDSGYHQLIVHWLRTHCVTEPYIIAANRQLSAMHPIYRLLLPHFRYTLEINALARDSLINAGGIIESSFSPGKYSMEFSSVVYDKLWRFDMEGLPADLIRRGMAVEDPTATHGLKLAIEDYPFANDALIMWDSIKQWVTDYVNHYYPEAKKVESDSELQDWWTEVRTKGHGDKKDEPWWPILKTQDDLIETLSTIIWVSSGHHAAVNFGQYLYGGYFPNRPSIARTNMPNEDPISKEDFNQFINKPEITLLRCFPSQIQATQVMAVLDVLSTHSPDEEYIGQKSEPSWDEDPVIKAAFVKFNAKMKELEAIIDDKNSDPSLKNRSGAGVVPYQLLKPFSKEGVTGRGVPTSISI
ncbi:linoleate 13S-lipoxygenase 2-1, chloroplastic [Ricinus communis]|uniref:Lipoxygenase n=1 Tax=Ricinus communis TaxID=3988 RepID=B9S3S5_RICCO|nr:linoleate 13S-lipoxygenase 2-1, chloroplastic [Ricinus communis]EEF41740.1 lipoxygenase, putative [Ricinus communis]|eukprot:XP_025013379.1 linoleate 13S-lipoxygenase 2-1, chloroplastic [Ricinus communis]